MKLRAVPLLLSPHRGFFLLGITTFAAVTAWWPTALADPPRLLLPINWLHAWLVMFGALAPFIAGFLFTAYSRWLGTDPPSPACWRSSLALQGTGTLLLVVGAYLGARWSQAGAACWLAGWLLVASHLARALARGDGATLHGTTMLASVMLGLVALTLLLVSLAPGQAHYAAAGLRVGFWGFLLGAHLVVTHRMIPFFAGCVLQPYDPYRPGWVLVLSLGLAWAHLLLLILGLRSWLWLPDTALALAATWLMVCWQWHRSGGHRLLAALFIGWFGLIAGLLASAAQSLFVCLSGHWVGGNAPGHIIGIAFFGVMVIAMGTRVTLGHSGRALRMGSVAWWSVLGIVLAAALRALADFGSPRRELVLASALVWTAAATAWLLRHGPMLLSRRVDGQPG